MQITKPSKSPPVSKLRNLLLLALALTFPVTVHSEVYQYHPNSRLYMGGGYNPFRPNEAFLKCIDYEVVEQVDTKGGGAVRTDARIILVKDRKEFNRVIEFSSALGAAYLFSTGSAGTQLVNENAFQNDSLSWVILFRSDFGKFTLKNPRIKPELLKLSADDLYERCGSEVVVEARRGVQAYALFTINHLNYEQKNRLEGQFRFKIASGASVVSTSRYKSFITNVSTTNRVDLTLNAIGGQGIQNLGKLLKQDVQEDFMAQFNSIPDVLADYMKGMDVEKSAPIQYVTAPLSRFVPELDHRYGGFKSKQLAELYELYQDLTGVAERLRQVVSSGTSGQYEVTAAEIAEYQKNLLEYTKGINLVYQSAQNCFDLKDSTGCTLPLEVTSLPSISWPRSRLDRQQCEFLRQFVWTNGLEKSEDVLELARRRDFAPYIRVTSEGVTTIKGWYHCDRLLSGEIDKLYSTPTED